MVGMCGVDGMELDRMDGEEFVRRYELADPIDVCGINRELKAQGSPMQEVDGAAELPPALTRGSDPATSVGFGDALTEPSPDSGFDQGDPSTWDTREEEQHERERLQSLAADLWMRVGANGLPTFSTGQIAEQCHRSPETIRKWKSELGWPDRPSVRPKQERPR